MEQADPTMVREVLMEDTLMGQIAITTHLPINPQGGRVIRPTIHSSNKWDPVHLKAQNPGLDTVIFQGPEVEDMGNN